MCIYVISDLNFLCIEKQSAKCNPSNSSLMQTRDRHQPCSQAHGLQRASFVRTQFPSPGNLLTLNKIKESFAWKLTSTTKTICTPTIRDLLLALSRDGETRRRRVVVCDRSDSGDDKQHLEGARPPNPPRYLPTSTKYSALAAIPSDFPR